LVRLVRLHGEAEGKKECLLPHWGKKTAKPQRRGAAGLCIYAMIGLTIVECPRGKEKKKKNSKKGELLLGKTRVDERGEKDGGRV